MKMSLKGIWLLCLATVLASVIARWGGDWEVFAKVLVCVMTVLVALAGVINFGMSIFGPTCDEPGCGNLGRRFCDAAMTNGYLCRRWLCREHVCLVHGKDLCPKHYEVAQSSEQQKGQS